MKQRVFREVVESREENTMNGVGCATCTNIRAHRIKQGVWREEIRSGREKIVGGL